MVQPLYAWPHDAASENKAAVVRDILVRSFQQSGTKINDPEALMSAARHIVQSERIAKLELNV
ncbi:MAG: hypothetical protein NDJ24_08155 [Alphaproteobacteria bacterium]|nr:hypothetical protein [Alphaproteobacteria bacterium]